MSSSFAQHQSSSRDQSVSDKFAITSSQARGTELAKAQAGKPTKKMSSELYGSIVLYTGNSIYRALNLALREKHAQVPRYLPYLRMLFEAMAATKSRKQRRLGLTRDDLKAGLKQLKIKARDLDSLFNHIDAKEQGALSEAASTQGSRNISPASLRAHRGVSPARR